MGIFSDSAEPPELNSGVKHPYLSFCLQQLLSPAITPQSVQCTLAYCADVIFGKRSARTLRAFKACFGLSVRCPSQGVDASTNDEQDSGVGDQPAG